MKAITLADAQARGLLAESKGIHTFSNGSEWDYWSARNCDRCKHYITDSERTDESCALEFAAMTDMVSPELARWFGWTESAEYPGSYKYPTDCPCRQAPDERDDDDGPQAPPPDPRQLVLLADPTEDAAAFAVASAVTPHPQFTNR